jgi:hypothetical protein
VVNDKCPNCLQWYGAEKRIAQLEAALREVRKLAGERDGLIDICRVIDSSLETKVNQQGESNGEEG